MVMSYGFLIPSHALILYRILFFPPCNFCKRRTYPNKTFWLLVSTLYPNCVKISRPYPLLVLNYWTGTKTTPQNKWFFWSNPPNIEVRITFLIELPNFAGVTKLWSHEHIYNIIWSRDKTLFITSWSTIITS